MNTIRSIFLAVLFGSAAAAHAQQELMLHQQGQLWYATALNPALFPEGKRIIVGLPSFGMDAAHSGKVTYNDILRREGDHTILDFSKGLDKLDAENDVRYDQRFETVSLGFRLNGKWYFQIGHAVRLSAAVHYPKALAELFWYGNGPYIGKPLEVGFTTTTFDWNEGSVGLARQLGKNLTLGFRAKFLSGISALQTDDAHRKVTVYTDPDIYQLNLSTDYAFHSSILVSSIDTAGLGFDLVRNELKNGFTANTGWAFDFGAHLKLGERLTLSASVLDAGGSITWKENSQYFSSKGSFTYNGVEIPGTDIINGTTDSLDFSAALDSLNDALQFQKSAAQFTTDLPLRIYLGGTFKLSDRWSFGAVLHHQKSERRSTTGVGVNAQWTPLRWLSVGAMYSVNDRSAANIGLSLIGKIGPVQAYILSDNALNAVTPYGSPAVNFRVGGALLF